jgi:osmoprotectant transport system ATP-binding protein
MIRLEHVSKSYDGTPVIDDLSLRVAEGQTIVLIGPSGCGKTTLLRMMVALARPDEGEVFIHGEQLTRDSTQSLRGKLGYVIQDGGLFPHLTGKDNVALPARYRGWDKARVEQRIAELVELTQFPADGLKRYPLQLSGGQRQRLSLMRALMLDPDVLLLDEPLGALDPMIRFDLQEDLKAIFAALGKTVVLVTHDLREASYFADEMVLLHDGRIEQQGQAGDFVSSPSSEFVSRFVSAQRSFEPGAA